ncbi:CPBP family intramembrane glutamic endopeptidase [Runella sp. SP2]|uniref:CPBP family intramembrane glutamic endopeptidase n=1 Tax=Runella sp. SP2 TaxID=2268026 RepID=UPI000F0912BA|nr:type II CAAX endopeptidase family protein [Runella sp. SP2]AYQ34483.1 CPBP family intramembrane metalloprotease [Runella sp. SP2]
MLPLQPNSFIDASKQGDNRLGLYVAVFLLVVIANVVGSIPGAWAMVELRSNELSLPIYLVMALVFLSFVVALGTLWFCVQYIHKRSPFTMIVPSGQVNWKRVVASGGLWLGCSVAVELVTYLLFPDKYRLSLNWSEFLPSLIVGLLFIPFQTSFEELFFRGYLMQGIGSWNFWVGVTIPAILFGLAHSFNDEVEAAGSLGIAMIYYIGVGVFFGLLTVYDRSLELPLGVHAANNLYAFLVVGYPSSSIPTATIWMMNELNFPLMIGQWLLTLGLYLLLRKRLVK